MFVLNRRQQIASGILVLLQQGMNTQFLHRLIGKAWQQKFATNKIEDVLCHATGWRDVTESVSELEARGNAASAA